MTTDDEHILIRMLRQHIDDSSKWRDSISERIDKLERQQGEMVGELATNTQITSAVHDAYTAGRVATRIVKWVGGVALAIGSIWWAVKEISHAGGGGGIGPTP